MIELFETNLRDSGRRSSKGNQLKWESERIWYKADYLGYEGLSEFAVSHLFEGSSLEKGEYVIYDPEEIRYGRKVLAAVKAGTLRMAGLRSLLKDYLRIITGQV